MRARFCIFAPLNWYYMVIELLIVWVVGVVAFFVLWAVLLKVIKKISERKSQKEETSQEETIGKEISPKNQL